MFKKLLLFFAFFFVTSALCMEKDLVAMDIDYGDMLTIQTNDPIEFQTPEDLAQLSGTLNSVIEDAGIDNPIPLPTVSAVTWRLIQDQLERVYNIRNHAHNAEQKKQEITFAYEKLGGQKLVDLIAAANYLDIPELLKITTAIAKENVNKISSEQLVQLPKNICMPLVRYAVFNILGHLPGKQIAQGIDPYLMNVSPDGNWIIGYSSEYTGAAEVYVWDKEGNLKYQWNIEYLGYPFVFEVTSTNKIVICDDVDTVIHVYDMNGEKYAEYGNDKWLSDVTVTSDNKIIVMYSNGDMCGWDIETGKSLTDCNHPELEKWVKRIYNNLTIINRHDKHVLYVGDAQGRELAQCHGHTDFITNSFITPDQKVVAISKDGEIRVWDVSIINKLKKASKERTKAIWKYLQEVSAKITENMQFQFYGVEYQITDAPIIPLDCWQHIQDILDGTQEGRSLDGVEARVKRRKQH